MLEVDRGSPPNGLHSANAGAGRKRRATAMDGNGFAQDGPGPVVATRLALRPVPSGTASDATPHKAKQSRTNAIRSRLEVLLTVLNDTRRSSSLMA